MVLTILIGTVKHSQSTGNHKFAIASLYIKKEVRDGIHFLHENKYQSFYKLAVLFLNEVVRQAQSTQYKKLGIFLQDIKNKVLQLFLCCTVMQKI